MRRMEKSNLSGDVASLMSAPYDAFITYKSEDADLVRNVADQLIASGIRVWFAEYQVLLQNYDQF